MYVGDILGIIIITYLLLIFITIIHLNNLINFIEFHIIPFFNDYKML
jgi:hypothetical protein